MAKFVRDVDCTESTIQATLVLECPAPKKTCLSTGILILEL